MVPVPEHNFPSLSNRELGSGFPGLRLLRAALGRLRWLALELEVWDGW